MVKLEIATDDEKFRKRQVPRWSEERGIEGLLFCFDEFKTIADELSFNGDDYFRYYPLTLDIAPRRTWKEQIEGLPTQDKTIERFQEEFNDFLVFHAGSNSPRDDLIDYLASEDCRKPVAKSVVEHVSRIVSLCVYANRLPGLEEELTTRRINLKVFRSFPVSWQNEYELYKGDARSAERREIIAYFEKKKKVVDDKMKEKADKNKRKTESEKDTSNKRQKSKVNICRTHGTHPWSECSLNPRSKNYFKNPTTIL